MRKRSLPRTALGEDRFATVTAAGRQLTLEHAVAEALAALALPVATRGAKDRSLAHAEAVTQQHVASRLAGPTPREVDVLQLVTEGLTNVQTAERLYLSPKTVSSHLVSVFAKLEVSSRSSAARVARTWARLAPAPYPHLRTNSGEGNSTYWRRRYAGAVQFPQTRGAPSHTTSRRLQTCRRRVSPGRPGLDQTGQAPEFRVARPRYSAPYQSRSVKLAGSRAWGTRPALTRPKLSSSVPPAGDGARARCAGHHRGSRGVAATPGVPRR